MERQKNESALASRNESGRADPALAPVAVLDPELPVAWHERNDPGAAQLAWITRSRTLVT